MLRSSFPAYGMIKKEVTSEQTSKKTRFIADAMLGRLARWLRFLGFDVLYYPDIDDRQVVRISREQDRTILTRDTGLLRLKGVNEPVFIESDHVPEQILQLQGRIDFSNADPRGRCVVCNGTLSEVSRKEEVRDAVPDYVYLNFQEFMKCESCGKVYWKGSHYKSFGEKMEALMRGDDED